MSLNQSTDKPAIESVSLAKWIENKRGVIMTYPETVDSYGVIASIITQPQFKGRPILVMSDDSDSIIGATKGVFDKRYFIAYDAEPKMLSSVASAKLILVIEDFRKVHDTKLLSILQNRDKENKLIIISSIGINQDELESAVELVSDPDEKTELKDNILQMSFLNMGPEPDYSLCISTMNPSQSSAYKLSASSEKDECLLRQIANFEMTEVMKSSSDVDFTKKGWMTPEIISRLKSLSPKLVQLLTSIKSNPNGRHVIYTHLKDKCGVDMIHTLLSYLYIDSIVVSVDNPLKDITSFNSGNRNGRVLIISYEPTVPVHNVSDIHFVEGFTYEEYTSIMGKILKRKNYGYGAPDFVRVSIYISRMSSKEDAIDAVKYREFSHTAALRKTMFDKLWNHSHPMSIYGGEMAIKC